MGSLKWAIGHYGREKMSTKVEYFMKFVEHGLWLAGVSTAAVTE